MKKSCVLLGLITVFTRVPLFGVMADPFPKMVAHYTMDVHLDTETHILNASEILTWTNSTSYPAEDLWFHLYWNAFQNNRSTFLQESPRLRGLVDKFRKNDWGYCRIHSMVLVDEERFEEVDLMPSMAFRQPDDKNPYDQTVFSVSLPRPVPPGGTIQLKIAFEARVPRPVSRTGVFRETYFIAQWFPKIGVFEEGRWNCHQYHAYSEFYADYGTYDVRITLPSSFIVGATGEHQEKIDNGDGTTTHHFVQDRVHDFAWTASPHYLEYKEDCAFAPDRKTEITLLLQPHHRHLKERYIAAVTNAIRYCSLCYGEYPYTTVTCVDPTYNSRSGGMEYPTFFTGGAYFLAPQKVPRPEGVTIHEFGHGYFYGLVGSNEFENPWMDEGFTSFLDSEIAYAAYGEPVYSRSFFGFPVTFDEVRIPIEADGISRHRNTFDRDIMQRFAWRFMDGESYGANSYAKAELMLRSLKRMIGKDLFTEMLRTYSKRWWFKHPKPEDFFEVVGEFAGEKMRAFVDQVVNGSEKLDYAVESISVSREEPRKGWFNGAFVEPEPLSAREAASTKSEVLVRRLGGVRIPVDVLVVFEDQTRVVEKWDGQYRWKRFTYTGANRVETAIVDPDFKLVLDINRTNNSFTRKPARLAPLKWTARWLTWLQHAMEFFSIFGG